MKPFILILSFVLIYNIARAQVDVTQVNQQQTADSTQVDTSASVNDAPPALPTYAQPDCPVDGYLWQPGYWAYSAFYHDYFWVPGTWVAPPQPGLLWTPSYWGFVGGFYRYHSGYWGASVGFYGGINYGYGYGGHGYVGGEWHDGAFRYNTAVVNVNRTVVHNTYINNRVIVNNYNHSSFNGRGGVDARPTPQEMSAMHQPHINPTGEQLSHQQAAVKNKGQFASANHGKPANVTMDRPHGNTYNNTGRKPETTLPNRSPENKTATNHNTQSTNTVHQPQQQVRQPQQTRQQAQSPRRQTQQPQRQAQQPRQQPRQQPQRQAQQPRQQTQQPRQQVRQRQVQQPRQQPAQRPAKRN